MVSRQYATAVVGCWFIWSARVDHVLHRRNYYGFIEGLELRIFHWLERPVRIVQIKIYIVGGSVAL